MLGQYVRKFNRKDKQEQLNHIVPRRPWLGICISTGENVTPFKNEAREQSDITRGNEGEGCGKPLDNVRHRNDGNSEKIIGGVIRQVITLATVRRGSGPKYTCA